MRSIWKGHIRFSLVTIPIRIYGAIETSKSISFRQLHKEDNGPVGYKKVCKTCDEKLASADIIKGYEYEPGQYAIIQPEDLDELKLKSTKIIEIEAFVDADEIDATLYNSPYFAGPDGEVAAKAYGLLTETLKRSGKMGIGKVVLRDRESVVLISPQGKGLMLHKLRYPMDIRKMEDVPQLDKVEVDESQIALAQTLVDSMVKNFDDLEFKDDYREAVMEMIDAKIKGKEVASMSDGEDDKPVVDIMTALKQSIDLAKAEKKPMKKVKAKKESDKLKVSKQKSA